MARARTAKVSVGERYGRWLVVGYDGGLKCQCRCDCGAEKAVNVHNLACGRSMSCGCANPGAVRHGATNSPEHRIWKAMRQRCSNPRHKNYATYGGAGIRVAPEWEVFETFLRDMGPRPSPKHSVDRIDGSKGYSKDNCRWATQSEQMNNTGRSVRVPLDGRMVTVEDAAAATGVSPWTIYYRLKAGWPPGRLFTPPRRGAAGQIAS